VYRLSRVLDAHALPHRFERPAGFDLATAWRDRKEQFGRAIPRFAATARISPALRDDIGRLEESTPSTPLPDPDDDGWTVVEVQLERHDPVGRLLRLGAEIEVLSPPGLRDLMRAAAAQTARLYRDPTG
jgi:predicted DNA-binding transcriptional regulator YafY